MHQPPAVAGLIRALAIVALAVLDVSLPATAADECPDCFQARYWTVPPGDWQIASPQPPDFPESVELRAARPFDLGVGFSGGGSRSAAATIGELRGLQQNGWLDRVRYVTAVSGGSWASVPFTFSTQPLSTLLGDYESPNQLNEESLSKTRGRLADAIAHSPLAPSAALEAAGIVGAGGILTEAYSGLIAQVRRRYHGVDEARPDKTYAHLLADFFIRPLIDSTTTKLFTWNYNTLAEMQRMNPRLNGANFMTAASNRPFLIVEGTMVSSNRNQDYPTLIPVEYTPFYSGVRQQFGTRLGGTYTWSWAYDSDRVKPSTADPTRYVLVGPGPTDQPFTLADVIASSGAAPQLSLLLGAVPAQVRSLVQQGAGFFPSFTAFAVNAAGVPTSTGFLPHGDGGFIDNLGLMPLLARQVKNIILFLNTNVEYMNNAQLKSYFLPLGSRTGEGDRSLNAVFGPQQLEEVASQFHDHIAKGEAVVACGENWEVAPNERYNIRGYKGLNICWVYNHEAGEWVGELDKTLQAKIFPAKDGKQAPKEFKTFPWFSTSALQLKPGQINLLANLTSWTVTSAKSRAKIASALRAVLPQPPVAALPKPRESSPLPGAASYSVTSNKRLTDLPR